MSSSTAQEPVRTGKAHHEQPAYFEVRRYIDGWLHFYRPEDLDSGREFVTPVCAGVDPFYGVDHARWLTIPTWRGEFHPACMTAVRGDPVRVPRLRQSPEDTVLLPVVAGAFRGQL